MQKSKIEGQNFKEHYRMYKAGKVWLFSGIITFGVSVGLFNGEVVRADTLPSTTVQKSDVGSTNTTQNSADRVVLGTSNSSTGTVQSVTASSNTTQQASTANSSNTPSKNADISESIGKLGNGSFGSGVGTTSASTESVQSAMATSSEAIQSVASSSDVSSIKDTNTNKTSSTQNFIDTNEPQPANANVNSDERDANVADSVVSSQVAISNAKSQASPIKIDSQASIESAAQLASSIVMADKAPTKENTDVSSNAVQTIDQQKNVPNVERLKMQLPDNSLITYDGLNSLNVTLPNGVIQGQINAAKQVLENSGISNLQLSVKDGILDYPDNETIKVILGNASKKYDNNSGTDDLVKVSVTPTELMYMPDLTEDDFTGVTSQDVGTYPIRLSEQGLQKLQSANPSQTITANNIKAGTFTITPLNITVTVSNTMLKVYDGTTKITLDNLIDAGVDSFTQPAADAVGSATIGFPKAGEFASLNGAREWISITHEPDVLMNDSDMSFKMPNTDMSSLFFQFLKEHPDINGVSKSDLEKMLADPVYGPKTRKQIMDFLAQFDFSGFTNPNVGTQKPSGLLAGVLSKDGTPIFSSVGYAPVNMTLAAQESFRKSNPNYNVTSFKAGQMAILPVPVTITAPTVSKMYDGKPYTGKFDATVDGKPAAGTPLNFTVEDVPTNVNVGKYTTNVTAKSDDNLNYTVTTKTGSVTITPNTESKIELMSASKVYDGDSKTDPTIYGVKLSEGLLAPTWTASDFDLSGMTSQNVGQYPVKLSATGLAKLQAVNPNYTITTANLTNTTLTITKAPVTIKANDSSKVVGQTDPKLTSSVTGQPAAGVQLTYQMSRNAGEAVGTYPITITMVTTDNANYDVTVISGTFSISSIPTKELSATVGKIEKTYDGTLNFSALPTVTITDTTGVKNLTLDHKDFDWTNVKPEVGQYTVTLSASGIAKILAANPGTSLTEANVTAGTVLINKAPVTVTAIDNNKVAGQTDPKLTVTVTGQPATGVQPTYQLSRTVGEEAGTYPITVLANATDNPNYDITVVNGTFTITPIPGKVLSATVGKIEKTYACTPFADAATSSSATITKTPTILNISSKAGNQVDSYSRKGKEANQNKLPHTGESGVPLAAWMMLLVGWLTSVASITSRLKKKRDN